jgi:serine/threonine protein kinase
MLSPIESTLADISATWNPNVSVSHHAFIQGFRRHKMLGNGGDGTVESYRHLSSEEEVAVKTPRNEKYSSVNAIESEIKNLKALGKHENISSMLAFSNDFQPIRPAIFYQVCDLGDLFTYMTLWSDQQTRMGQPKQIAENTVWKLFRDMIMGLDFLHNGHSIGFVHNDFKPENILVLTPPDHIPGLLPAQPIFKITDFARLSMFPTPLGHTPEKWSGTYEYGPPRCERAGPTGPSVDMWGLGATIQTFALDIMATQSRRAFIKDRVASGSSHPDITDAKAWGHDYWRARLPVIYRPLHATREVLFKDWDVPKGFLQNHSPYSVHLNFGYAQLLDKNPRTRATSAHLKKYIVPWIDQDLLCRKEMMLPAECLEKTT